MIVHATAAQLAAEPWSVSTDQPGVLLRAASRLVDGALLTAVYATDDGRATDPRVLGALADATCAQAAAWAALGIDPVTGLPAEVKRGPVKAKALGTASFDYDTTEATLAAQARTRAATSLAPEAWQILADAGLLTGRVWVSG